MRVLMITTEWPSIQSPNSAVFIVRQVEYLRRAGVEVDVFHFRGAKKPWNYFSAWFKVRQKLIRGNYDLIHAQWGQSAFPALPKCLPLVITFRGSDVERIVDNEGHYLWQGYFLSQFSRLAAILADQAIVVSASLDRKLPKRKYHVIPSGLDFEMFRPIDQEEARKRLGIPLDSRIILFGGDLKRGEKRFTLAQAAIEIVKASIPNIKFLIPQGVSHELMPFYINSANVMLLTSLYEGSPNIVKEALACNIPVVSTDVGDVRCRIGSIDGCAVCADNRPETIAIALRQILSRGKRIDGRETIYDLDENLLTQKVIKVYEEALF